MLRNFRKLHKTHHKAILIYWALNTSVFPYNDEFSSIWFVKMFCTSIILDHDNYPSGKGQALDFEKSGFTINPTASCTESQHAYKMRLSRNSTKCFLARTYVTGYNYIPWKGLWMATQGQRLVDCSRAFSDKDLCVCNMTSYFLLNPVRYNITCSHAVSSWYYHLVSLSCSWKGYHFYALRKCLLCNAIVVYDLFCHILHWLISVFFL